MAVRPRRILVGYDGTPVAGRALDAAADLVGYGSTLAVVTVQTGELRRSVVAEARGHLRGRHVEARYHEPRGEPAEQLVEAARELDVDLVVVGRRDRPQLRGSRSSVSWKVVRGAPCDVLVVR